MPLRKSRVLPILLYQKKKHPLRRSKSDLINKKQLDIVNIHVEINIRLLHTSETEGELSDDSAGDGETNEEWPVTAPFTTEEDWPWIELPHFLFLLV